MDDGQPVKQHKPAQYFAWSEEKRAKLTQRIALLGAAVCLFYLVFDYVSDAHDYLYFYGILFAGSATCLVLLKYGKYTTAKLVLLLSGVTLLTILAAWETRETGLYLYHMVVAMGAIALFSTKEKWVSVGIATVLFISFYISYFSDFIGVSSIPLTQEYIDFSFLSNFIICLIATIIMFYYILSISRKGEEQMIVSHQSLQRTTQELEESQNRFELAIKGSSVGIWDWHITNNEFYVSPQLKDLLGYSNERYVDITFERVERLVHPDDLSGFKKAIDDHFTHHEPFQIECRFRRGDDTYMWVLDSGQAQWDEHGKPIRMVGTVVNIEAQKISNRKLEEQNALLEKTNEELDRFVYSTSHDLKAPLSSIAGLVDIALRSDDATEKNKCLQLILNRAHAMEGFIREIIDYSRNSRLEVLHDIIMLKKLVDDVIKGLRFYDKSTSLRFDIDIPAGATLSSDVSRLKVILNNLLANAIKYHDLKEGAFVKVTMQSQGDKTVIIVSDNGAGIDPAFHDRLFDMFFRASEHSQGSGLGLYIAQEAAHKLGGHITFESAPSVGSTFYLTLPA